jgi:hypothetical protein
MGKTLNSVIQSTITSKNVELSTRRRKGRAVNAVADYLRSHLRVPNVYIAPSGLSRVDVLAADAAGSGDIHAVSVEMLTKPIGSASLKLYVELVKNLQAHFKYLAIPKGITNIAHDPHLFFAADGIGRVGVLVISESMDLSPTVELAIKPERFRLPSDELAQVERYLDRAKPDMFVRV